MWYYKWLVGLKCSISLLIVLVIVSLNIIIIVETWFNIMFSIHILSSNFHSSSTTSPFSIFKSFLPFWFLPLPILLCVFVSFPFIYIVGVSVFQLGYFFSKKYMTLRSLIRNNALNNALQNTCSHLESLCCFKLTNLTNCLD